VDFSIPSPVAGLGRTEIRVEAAEDVDDESLTSDGGADVIESVGEALHLAGILGDGHVTLVQAVELLLRVHGTLQAVVERRG
jgi:hypothetical protein